MTFEQRQHIRHAISRHKLAQLKAHHTQRTNQCPGCGIHKTQYTTGCKPCENRARYRRWRDTQNVPCLGCGTPLRKSSLQRRQHRGGYGAGIQKCRACLNDTCVGCGNPVDQYTRGCETCRSRHYRRRRAQEAQEALEAA